MRPPPPMGAAGFVCFAEAGTALQSCDGLFRCVRYRKLPRTRVLRAASRAAEQEFREAVTAHFGNAIEMGRSHERPVGPHPQWSYQITFAPSRFAEVVSWLALNRGALDVFVHPNTGDELGDHRDRAIWLGRSYELNLEALTG